ncbi:DUF1080 domain-containing protein [candidate division KSB1 bacterium]|nr:DUF1080 domain-containing protein [candidate division KSB1 bacterium]
MLGCSDKQKTDTNAVVSLFDGKSLAGWEGDLNWFRVEDGSIVGGSLEKDIPHNMFLCTTKEYGNFELKIEAKLVGPGDNSGIQFRSRRVPGTTEVSGYQADMGGPIGDFGVVWGSLYDEARRNKMLVTANQEEIKKAYRTNDWNEMVLKCKDNHIQVWVNGYQSVDYTEDDDSIAKKGIIGFQIHAGAPTEVWLRNITLTEL